MACSLAARVIGMFPCGGSAQALTAKMHHQHQGIKSMKNRLTMTSQMKSRLTRLTMQQKETPKLVKMKAMIVTMQQVAAAVAVAVAAVARARKKRDARIMALDLRRKRQGCTSQVSVVRTHAHLDITPLLTSMSVKPQQKNSGSHGTSLQWSNSVRR